MEAHDQIRVGGVPFSRIAFVTACDLEVEAVPGDGIAALTDHSGDFVERLRESPDRHEAERLATPQIDPDRPG